MNTSAVTVQPVGERAVLLDCGSNLSASNVVARIRELPELLIDLQECIPAATSVLLQFRTPTRMAHQVAVLTQELGKNDWASIVSNTGSITVAELVIDVVYTGADLVELSNILQMSPEALVAAHTRAHHRVEFMGFAPGFAYISSPDSPLQGVPRKHTPRHTVPKGSVALAGDFSGIYPNASPGGWQLIGHTAFEPWNIDADPPTRLEPGTRITFRSVREQAPISQALHTPNILAPQPFTGEPALSVVRAGLQTTVQDGGRPGLGAYAVSHSGAMDMTALREVNRVLGNPLPSPALEITQGGASFEVNKTLVMAVTGAPNTGTIQSKEQPEAPLPMYTPFRVDSGDRIHIGTLTAGARVMLNARGGLQTRPKLGSSSWDSLAGFGTPPMQVGDQVWVHEAPTFKAVQQTRSHAPRFPVAGEIVHLRVTLGPRESWFSVQSRQQLLSELWYVTPLSNRVGTRLEGDEPLRRAVAYEGKELSSEGVIPGAIQVPASGQPVLFLQDSPRTGGYPVIAVLHDDDLWLAGQLPPGAKVRFVLGEQYTDEE